MTVRAASPLRRSRGPEFRGEPPQLGVQRLAVGQVALEGLLDRDRDALGAELEAARVDRRSRGRGAGARRFRGAPRAGRRPQGGRARRPSRCPLRAGAPPRAGPLPGARAPGTAPGSGPRDPAGTTVIPPGLRRSDATLHTTLAVETPSEQDRLAEPRTAVRTASASPRARAKPSPITRREIEVALVEAGALDARHDLPHGRPDRLRVLAVEAHAAAARRPPPDSGGAPRPQLIAEWMPKRRAT